MAYANRLRWRGPHEDGPIDLRRGDFEQNVADDQVDSTFAMRFSM